MKVHDFKLGRLGNAIFRYFASTLFCIIYDAKRTYNSNELNATINDDFFINWMNHVLNDNIPNIGNHNYNFYGYFQHDKIFIKFKNELLLWINNHGDELLYTDGNDQFNNNYNYNIQSYKASELIIEPSYINKWDVVIHIRLEDFIFNNDVIHPDCILKILKNIKNYNSYCLVLNKPKSEIEKEYIKYIKNNIDFEIYLQTGTVIEDFHVMKNSKLLVCSCSTLSWIASFMSNTIETVYFPNKNKQSHESFCKPIDNTIYYDIIKCSKNELEKLFNIKNNEKDIYSIKNFKGEPITNILVDYIKDIKNGFYVDVGAYDGLFQNSTKYIEDKFNWNGLLIEPSSDSFDKLKKNRPDNILINKCIVSNKYKFNYIKFALNCGPMSSVNNIRQLQNVNLLDVKCDNLTNIFKTQNIKKIDLLIINTEGYEYEVLEGIDFKKYKPTYLLITIFKETKDKVFEIIDRNNFIFLENVTNYNIFDNPQWDGKHNTFLFRS